MTTYFDTRQRWIAALGVAEDHPDALRELCKRAATDPTYTNPGDLEERGWATYLQAVDCHAVGADVVLRCLDVYLRRDLRAVALGLAAVQHPCLPQMRALLAKHPPYEGMIPEDLDAKAARVGSLCSDAHSVMHAIAQDLPRGDNPVTCARLLWGMLEEPTP
jgi:hypothetical protein